MRPAATLLLGATLLTAACGELGREQARTTPSGTSVTSGTTTSSSAPEATTPSQEDAVQTSTSSTPVRATLSARLEPGELGAPYPEGIAGLTVSYTVTNDGSEPVLVVLERGHSQSSSSTAPASPAAAWVGAGSAHGVARLSKQIFDAPSGATLTTPWRAPAQLLAGGESLEGSVLVPLPLRPDLPATSDVLTVGDRPLAGDERQVEICVQVAPDPRAVYPDAFVDEITHATPGRSLVYSDPAPLPTR